MPNILDSHVGAYQGGSVYDFDNHLLLKWYPERIVEFSGNAQSLLELGLGHGITTNIFGRHFRRHVVVDGSPAVIANFRKQFPDAKAELVESYFETFQSEERFDVIVLGFILEHVDDPIVVLRHVRQFLAPNGRIFVTVPNAESLNRRLGHRAGLLSDMQLLSDHDHLLGHKRYYTTKTLKADIEQSGYRLKRLEGMYLKPFTTTQILSLSLGEKVFQALCDEAIAYPELSCAMLAELVP